jgi:NADH-quinone oxidoreductase E subunit
VSEPRARSAAAPALSEDAKRRIDALRPLYPTARALLLPALHVAQREQGGWLPEATMVAVGAHLGLAASEVMGVVTFYDLFHQKPVGRHRLRVCTNLSCTLRGANEIMETLHQELGVGENVVTGDGRCSFVHFECLGSCDTAPMMMVDDEYHENLTPAKVRALVKDLG